jgi:hypothetical protein
VAISLSRPCFEVPLPVPMGLELNRTIWNREYMRVREPVWNAVLCHREHFMDIGVLMKQSEDLMHV